MGGLPHLGDRTAAAFLSEFWQKQPLHIPGAFPDWHDPLSPEELAGLALEPGIHARLVKSMGPPAEWLMSEGPFEPADFETLPDHGWTVLVQEVNHHIPEVAALLDRFRFIPNWRLDDVMASYAAPGGTVGPHVDSYDVFLIQGMGQRTWRTGRVAENALLPDIPLQVLETFTPEREWTLSPGDMLYLPPGVPHHGVGDAPCMTWSVGFRAPTHQELVARFLEAALPGIDPSIRYADPDLSPTDNPGRIDRETLARIATIIRDTVTDDDAIGRWFGCAMTEPAEGPISLPDDRPPLPEGRLWRNPASRWVWLETGDGISLCVDGQQFPLPADLIPLATLLCGSGDLDEAALAPWRGNATAGALLTALIAMGALDSNDGELWVDTISWEEGKDRLSAIRTTVFVEEQHVPEALEWDGLDPDAHHVLATLSDGTPVGCGRMVVNEPGGGRIGRMAVLFPYRGRGAGAALLHTLLDLAAEQGLRQVSLNAQVSAVSFYEMHGFVAEGPEFMDAGIPHRYMVREIIPHGDHGHGGD